MSSDPPSSVGKPYEEGSMEPYKFEVFQQCFAATEAWNRAERRLSNVPAGGSQGAMLAALKIVADLQGFMVAVGILSDLFFPTGPGDSKRGERLCELYSVPKDSPLSHAGTLVRHALVHIDRELDKWLKGQVGKTVGPVAIEPWTGPPPPRDSSTAARIIDNVNWRILVLGFEVKLKPLLLEVGRISTLFPLEFDGPSGKVRIEIAPPA